jgi:hypothetical protein
MSLSCRAWVNVAFIAFLTGCAADTWEKAGTAESRRDQELAECRAEARRAVDRDVAIDRDILASRTQDWSRTGTLEQRRQTMSDQTRGRAEDIVDGCMRRRGYVRPS